MKIRLASLEDSDDILSWRNNFMTRRMSNSSELIDSVSHDRWMQLSLKNQFCTMLIGITGDVKVGLCRFDIDRSVAMVSINLSPVMRKKGLGKSLLKESVIYFKSLNNSISLKATIKKENLASNKCFLACNFNKVDEDNEYIYYEYP